MLVKHLQKRLTLLKPTTYTATTTNLFSKSSESDPDTTRHSKNNPNGIKDLRGNQNIQNLTTSEQSYSPILPSKLKLWSAANIASKLSNNTARFLGSLVENPRTTIASDNVNLPKIYSGSIPIYDSLDSVASFMVSNKLIFAFSPLVIFFVSPSPYLTLLFYSIGTYFYHGLKLKWAKHLVFKLQLLPNTQEVAYQKINLLGNIVTRKAKIEDLQYMKMEDITSDIDPSEKGVRGFINKNVIFKVKDTNEYLVFEKDGIWFEEGLKHQLLV